MIIKLSPQRRDDTLNIVKAGDSLIINDEVFNFAQMRNGDTLPISAISSQWFAGDVNRDEGELTVCLTLPLPSNYSPEQAFPVDIVNVPDGPVALPQPLPLPLAQEVPAE